jgi:hypothetical protein
MTDTASSSPQTSRSYNIYFQPPICKSGLANIQNHKNHYACA